MQGPDHLLTGLTGEQREAVTTEATPLLVLAGAGSGKTRVLTRRIAWHAATERIDARRVLAVTFTRKAASELARRLRDLGIGEEVTAGTFHALALAQLRRLWLDRGRRPPKLLEDKSRLLSRLLPRGDGERGELLAAVAREIEWAQARLLDPGEYEALARHTLRSPPLPPGEMAALYDGYRAEKRRRGVVDFDDLLVRCAHEVESDHELAAAVHWRFRHLFVDEFQDLNPAQFRLLEAWLGGRGDLAAVGDDDQAIYGFGGADTRYLADFRGHIGEGATVLRLTANFRSTPQILSVANAVIAPAPGDERRLRATAGDGPLPTLAAYETDAGEAAGIVETIGRLRREGIPARDFAVLARTNAQCTFLEQALSASRIPARLRDDGRLPEPREPEYAEDGGSRDAVEVLTFHRAKGLEWPVVFVTGLEDGFVPISHASSEAARHEERRLLHVALTRAGRRLFLSWARARSFGGGRRSVRNLSPFLAGLDAHLPGDPGAPPPPATETGREALSGAAAALAEAAPSAPSMRTAGGELLRALVAWRERRARAAGVPEAAILDDTTLRAISARRPVDEGALGELPGVGAFRLARYGPEILDLVTEYAR